MGILESFTNSIAFPIVLAVLILIVLILICWKRVPADKAMVITGLKKRVLVGKGGVQIPFLETSCMISLEAVSMTTDITEAPSKQGIFVDIAGTAVVKVDSHPDMVLVAVEQFCNGNTERTTQNIRTVVEQILEGKLRGIVSTLTGCIRCAAWKA
ncbi:MAG: flotillin family protein, partial [Bacteroidales bacterium]|nr:flotillin family protein [Bacteroidales bacterium]